MSTLRIFAAEKSFDFFYGTRRFEMGLMNGPYRMGTPFYNKIAVMSSDMHTVACFDVWHALRFDLQAAA